MGTSASVVAVSHTWLYPYETPVPAGTPRSATISDRSVIAGTSPNWADVLSANGLRPYAATPTRTVLYRRCGELNAAALAAMGHRVVAVEPTAELRTRAMAVHASPLIEWRDDGLPELASFGTDDEGFDLVMLTAVWMHLDAGERRRAMAVVAGLLAPGGLFMLALRHGPHPIGRRMFDVDPGEIVAAAEGHGLQTMRCQRAESAQADNREAGVWWTRMVFRRDGLTLARPDVDWAGASSS